jgi:hypothetical protein
MLYDVFHTDRWAALDNDFGCGLFHLSDLEIWITVDVTGRQGMLTSPKHLILSLLYPLRSVFASLSD